MFITKELHQCPLERLGSVRRSMSLSRRGKLPFRVLGQAVGVQGGGTLCREEACGVAVGPRPCSPLGFAAMTYHVTLEKHLSSVLPFPHL